ncbi:hypothetical protein [Roseovarius ramblicola]|uniref:Uncharacterized protein n=1 Tax=Roseovarius ramblicola TaxID=2022336 RepID=A0ABV5HZK1_9RHOB
MACLPLAEGRRMAGHGRMTEYHDVRLKRRRHATPRQTRTGDRPEIPVREGKRHFVDWYRDYHDIGDDDGRFCVG